MQDDPLMRYVCQKNYFINLIQLIHKHVRFHLSLSVMCPPSLMIHRQRGVTLNFLTLPAEVKALLPSKSHSHLTSNTCSHPPRQDHKVCVYGNGCGFLFLVLNICLAVGHEVWYQANRTLTSSQKLHSVPTFLSSEQN